jgi:16S rRNA (guanine(966)-N(2))-methyltransferase RsmD
MRIVGGAIGGRRYELPAKLPARPTTDRAKEGLFNILQHLIDIDGLQVLDLFGGSGGVSYEFLSRGAASATLVELDRRSVAFIRKAAGELGLAGQLEIIQNDALKFLKNTSATYDLIFADPPYALPQLPQLPEQILSGSLLQPDGLFILEHSTKTTLPESAALIRTATYGDSTFSIFRKPA